MFFKNSILKNLEYSQETHVSESLFIKVVTFNFSKRRLQHRYFPVNILEIIKNTYFVEHLLRVRLPIAVSAVENVLTFNISIFLKLAE